MTQSQTIESFKCKIGKRIGNVDQIQLEKVLTASFKTNSRTSYIYSFACLFVLEKTLARKHFFRAEELMAQADVVDGKLLRFEGGLTLTGLAVHSIYNLSKAAHKAPSFSEKQIVMLSNYLLSRKGVTDERGGFYMLTGLFKIASDNLLTPVAVILSSSKIISQDEKETVVKLKICNLVGDPLLVNNVVLVFLLFAHLKSGKEVGFLVSFDKTINSYSFTLDMTNFSGPNGKYCAYLIVGDSLMKNPTNWNIFDVFVDLSKKKTKAKTVATARKLSHFAAETMKPNFSISSDAKSHHHRSFGQKLTCCVFTVCCCAPLFFVLWLFFGANLNSFKKPLCVWAICFHSCLFVIFVLYSLFWLYYSHITTLLKQVFVVGIVAFVCGNQLLHRLAIYRKEESGEESESEVEEQQSESELDEIDEVESHSESEDYDLESDEKRDLLLYKNVDKDNCYEEFREDEK
uniref:Dolichyl-diphosphooligosaccharide--protein glycosyltransferase subunit 2 n=1 Tax=Ditylenchus dipsaci TaxID=166011 RepID=A0A915CLW8_9BILA